MTRVVVIVVVVVVVAVVAVLAVVVAVVLVVNVVVVVVVVGVNPRNPTTSRRASAWRSSSRPARRERGSGRVREWERRARIGVAATGRG